MTETNLEMQLYSLEKDWINKVNLLLIDSIPSIKSLFDRLSGYTKQNKFDVGYGDRYAWIQNSTLIIKSQNFKFMITDDECEFQIKYKILDGYTKKHVTKVLGVNSESSFIYISKKGEKETIPFLTVNNYDFFKIFISDLEGLKIALDENEG